VSQVQQAKVGAIAPQPAISVADAIALTIGIVVGAGIFSTPSLVAGNSGSQAMVLLAWGLGGAVSLAGALVYAELATTYPHTGGDYYFLSRSFGQSLAFLFAWARATVIQTGSIAFLAFVFGDYATRIVPLGPYSSAVYAVLVILALTGLNILGVRQGTWTQNVLTIVEVLGVILIIAAGFSVAGVPAAAETAAPASPAPSTNFGLMMVFVLLTYGGWNEAAYVSAELRDVKRNMVRALVFSILIITGLYILANLAYLNALGLSGVAGSSQIAADVMGRAFGEFGAVAISVLVAISALTSANASIFTGARTSYAFGRDVPEFAFLGRWSAQGSTPRNALLVQGIMAVALVFFGAWTRQGLQSMIDYTAPVFWFFFLCTGLSLFVLRLREPRTVRGFSVPLFPITPLLFCAASGYLLYSSLNYARGGSWLGVGVVAAGVVLLVILRSRRGPRVTPGS
jgi:amino acid transporter